MEKGLTQSHLLLKWRIVAAIIPLITNNTSTPARPVGSEGRGKGLPEAQLAPKISTYSLENTLLT